jgi:hypothetical protein
MKYKGWERKPCRVSKGYEKIKDGYLGLLMACFELVDSWIEKSEGRNVFKFKLHVTR